MEEEESVTDEANNPAGENPEATPSTDAAAESASPETVQSADPADLAPLGSIPLGDVGGSPAAPEAAAPAPEPLAEAPKARESDGCFLGVGRRKSAVARVRMRKGEGRFIINGREIKEYFRTDQGRMSAQSVLVATERGSDYDVLVRVQGGGVTGQAGAIVMGTARALMRAEPSLEPALRRDGFLTRDARMIERKKYGRRGARRSFQFSKR